MRGIQAPNKLDSQFLLLGYPCEAGRMVHLKVAIHLREAIIFRSLDLPGVGGLGRLVGGRQGTHEKEEEWSEGPLGEHGYGKSVS